MSGGSSGRPWEITSTCYGHKLGVLDILTREVEGPCRSEITRDALQFLPFLCEAERVSDAPDLLQLYTCALVGYAFRITIGV